MAPIGGGGGGGGGGGAKSLFFSNRIRTLVAMEIYSSHRLIIGKEEIDKFFCLNGDIWREKKNTEMFIE